jgi:hypothetical protein
MTNEQFNLVFDGTIAKITSVLCKKAGEYARGDRLHNFKVAAALASSSPEMALRGMLSKHIISVWDLINDVEQGKNASLEMWDEKIIDSMNYLLLLRAIVHERDYQKALAEEIKEKIEQ